MTLVKSGNINSLFDELFNTFPATWGRDFERNNGFTVQVNVHESKEAYNLELNAPGRSKEDFKLLVENGLLTISFEQKETTENKDYKTIRREFSYQSFKRSFTLDEKIDAENIQAKYENGVLKLHLPKKETVKESTKQITIL